MSPLENDEEKAKDGTRIKILEQTINQSIKKSPIKILTTLTISLLQIKTGDASYQLKN